MPAPDGDPRSRRRKCVQTLRKCARAAHVPLCADDASRERVAEMVSDVLAVNEALGGPDLQRAEKAFEEYEATFREESAEAKWEEAENFKLPGPPPSESIATTPSECCVKWTEKTPCEDPRA